MPLETLKFIKKFDTLRWPIQKCPSFEVKKNLNFLFKNSEHLEYVELHQYVTIEVLIELIKASLIL